MLSFNKLTQALFKDKIRVVHTFVLIEVIALITGIILTLVSNNHGSMNASIFAITFTIAFFASVIMFFMVTTRQERVWTRNIYRLIPVSSAKLYLSNVSSVFLTYLYFGIIQIVLLIIFNVVGLISSFKYTDEIMKTLSNAKIPYGIMLSVILLLIVIALFVWVFVTLVHLTVESITTFLPTVHEKIYRIILYVVVSYIVIRVVGYIISLGSTLFTTFSKNIDLVNNGSTGAVDWATASPLMAAGYLVVAVILISFINIVLLKKWVETDPRSI